MIVKYEEGLHWHYVDNVKEVETQILDPRYEAKKYDEMVSNQPEPHSPNYKDPAEYDGNGEKLPERIATSNKAFLFATYDIDDLGCNVSSKNLIETNNIDNLLLIMIIIRLEDRKDFDVIVLVTNQQAYLMNDKGQTIERLS